MRGKDKGSTAPSGDGNPGHRETEALRDRYRGGHKKMVMSPQSLSDPKSRWPQRRRVEKKMGVRLSHPTAHTHRTLSQGPFLALLRAALLTARSRTAVLLQKTSRLTLQGKDPSR